jgi:chemotaxis protein histidine kinase CheA
MDFELDELRRQFLAEAETKVKEIAEKIHEENPPSTESVERMAYLAHQLKGSGGSYGFEVISTEAAALEKDLEQAAGEAEADYRPISRRVELLSSVIRRKLEDLSPTAHR